MNKRILTLFIVSLALAGCATAQPKVGTVSVVPVTDTTTSSSQNPDQSSINSAGQTATQSGNQTPSSATSSTESTTNQTSMTEAQAKADQLAAPKKGDTVAILDTSYGTIKFKLLTKEAPEITKNFIELAKAGKYTNVLFHRVIKDFMIQTGDFEKNNGMGGYSYNGPGTKLDDEIVPGLLHYQYTVSMANSGPNTNGSQFFIVSAKDGAHWLDGSYSIFGQVYEGQSVVDKIQAVTTGANDKPVKDVLLKSVKIATY